MDPPPPYDSRRLSSASSSVRHHLHHHDSSSQSRSNYHLLGHAYVSHSHSHPNNVLQPSHSTHFPYYLSASSSRPASSESSRHISSSSMPQLLYRRTDGSGSNPDSTSRKHPRLVDEFSGSRSISGSSDPRDRKKSRVSDKPNHITSDFRERNTRPSFDSAVKESSSGTITGIMTKKEENIVT